MIVQPEVIPPGGPAPDRADRATFNPRAVALVNYWNDEMVPGVNAANNAAYQNALEAKTRAEGAENDRIQTGLDRIQTGLDRQQTTADAEQSRLYTISTTAAAEQARLDRIQTGQDRQQTGLDRQQTSEDRAAAQAFATQQLKATSATQFANTPGVKNIVLTPNKPFLPNVTYLRGASRGTPTVQNAGYLTAYNAATGAATLVLTENYGATTAFADWDFGVGAPGGAPGISVVAPDTITNCNDLPNSTITRITSTSAAATAKNLPVVNASDTQPNWNYNILFTVETVGFDTLNKVQTAIPLISSNNNGAGLTFVRKMENGTWGRWCPQGRMPSSLVTSTIGFFYDPNNNLGRGEWGLNRVNIISTGLTDPCDKYVPSYPVEGDRFIIVTNHRSDNRIYPIGGVGIRTGGVVVSADAENLTLDNPYTAYSFLYMKDHGAWFLE